MPLYSNSDLPSRVCFSSTPHETGLGPEATPPAWRSHHSPWTTTNSMPRCSMCRLCFLRARSRCGRGIFLPRSRLGVTTTTVTRTSAGALIERYSMKGGPEGTGCCASAAGRRDGGDDGRDTSPVGLCFRADSSTAGRRRLKACLDPTLLNFGKSTPQVARDASTRHLAHPSLQQHRTAQAEEEEVLRIRIVAAATDRGQQCDGNKTVVVVDGRRCGARTVWWQGPRAGVLHQGERPRG